MCIVFCSERWESRCWINSPCYLLLTSLNLFLLEQPPQIFNFVKSFSKHWYPLNLLQDPVLVLRAHYFCPYSPQPLWAVIYKCHSNRCVCLLKAAFPLIYGASRKHCVAFRHMMAFVEVNVQRYCKICLFWEDENNVHEMRNELELPGEPLPFFCLLAIDRSFFDAGIVNHEKELFFN